VGAGGSCRFYPVELFRRCVSRFATTDCVNFARSTGAGRDDLSMVVVVGPACPMMAKSIRFENERNTHYAIFSTPSMPPDNSP